MSKEHKKNKHDHNKVKEKSFFNDSDNSNNINVADNSGTINNKLKWVSVFSIILIMSFANIYLSEYSLALRSVFIILISIALLFIAKTTTQGEKAWKFIHNSQLELKKVVWPTRKETFSTTLLVIVVVLITSTILWIFDSLFFYLIHLIIKV